MGGTTDMEFALIGTYTAADWEEWYQTNVEVTEGGIVIATDPLPTYGSSIRIDGDRQRFDAVDVTVDGYGMVYVLATDGDIYRYDPYQELIEQLTCVWDPDDNGEPTAIAVTNDSLYVADGRTGRVQALSIYLLQTRWITDAFENPVGLTTDCGTVYVLDTDTPDAAMSATGRVVRLGPGGETETVVQGLHNPSDIASDTAGNVYVLGSVSSNDPVIDLFESASLENTDETDTTADIRIPPEAFTINGTGTPLVPSCLEAINVGELVVGVGPEMSGKQTLFRYRPSERAFERLPDFSGSSIALQSGQAARSDQGPPLYVVDGAERTVHRLSPTKQPQRNDTTGQYDAQAVRRFDSGERGTEWHRVTMGLELGPSQTQVRLTYATTDDGDDSLPAGTEAEPAVSLETVNGLGSEYVNRLQEASITDLGELVELTPGELALILGTERHSVSLHTAAELLDQVRSALNSANVSNDWRDQAVQLLASTEDVSDDVKGITWRDLNHPNPEDALLDDAEGRYLWVKLELIGNETSSPRIESFSAYFPRRSYLRYLPAVYRENERSAAFLERYLSLFESTFVDIEEEIGSVSKFLDPNGIPSEHLLWLGSWLAVEADDTWSAVATRELIVRAPELYKKRGTAEGLLAMLRIYLENTATISSGENQGTADHGREPLTGGSGPTDGRETVSSTSRETTIGTAGTEVITGAEVREGETSKNNGETTGNEGSEGDTIPAGAKSVYLLEHSDLSCIETPALSELYSRLISCPQGFLVLVHPSVDDEHLRTIKRIVDTQQPAHATGQAVHLRPWLMLNGGETDEKTERGFHTYLGINSRLSSREFRVDEAGLGQDTMLVEREAYGHLELQSRLGRDAWIN